MEQGFSCSTPAFRNTDILEGICRKKSNVICNLVPLRCDSYIVQGFILWNALDLNIKQCNNLINFKKNIKKLYLN